MTTRRGAERRGRLMWLGLVTLSATFAGASPVPVDAERQSSVFKRIFSYDKELRNTEKIIVLVVSATRDGAEAMQVASIFREKGLFPAILATSDLSDDPAAALTAGEAVVYVTAGADTGKAKTFAAGKGFLTISGDPTLAEEGHVSVSVDVAGERPEIVVNLARLQIEGHELSAELLNLARVIR